VTADEAVAEHVAAFNAHDTERLLAGFAPDAVWITGADTVAGRAALADLFDDWLWSTAPQLTALSVVADGDRAAAQLREAMTLDGQRREFMIAVFFDLADGLIRRAKVYREGSADV
jgi:ketosteroid isomerase-like protein